MTGAGPGGPRVAGWRLRLADLVTGGHLTGQAIAHAQQVKDRNDTIADQERALQLLQDGGDLTGLVVPVSSREDLTARVILGAVLARREVRAAVPPRLLEHWEAQHQALTPGARPQAVAS